LPEAAVKESKDRVRSAIINSGLNFPARRITLNLASADLPKDGGRFDLAIALGILSASVQVPTLTLDDVECLGELALSGAVRPVRGVLPAALAARKAGRMLVVPRAESEALEVAAIQSVASCVPLSHWPQRPFRQPHHSASGPALVGGGCRILN
ncbi:Magnesium chelatase, subunit ChlI, partial [Pseudomonas sp. NFACC24-1]